MDDTTKELFDTMLLEWKKAKAQACVDNSESLDCTRADDIRAYQENLRNQGSYYTKPVEERTVDDEEMT